MASTRLGYLAVKTQAAASPTTAVVPTHFLRFKDGDMELMPDVIINNPIQNNRWSSLNVVQGKVKTDGSYKFDVDPNEIVHWLRLGLGTITSSTDISSGTDATVYSHQIDVSDTPLYLTVEQGKGNLTDTTGNRQNYRVSRAFGVMVDQWMIKGADKELELAVKLKAHGIFERAKLLNNQAATASPATISLDQTEGLTSTEPVNIFDSTPQNEARSLTAVSTSANTVTVAAVTNSYTVANNAQIELQPLTPSFSTAAIPFSFAHVNAYFAANITAAASASEDNIENWELTFNNNLDARYGSARFGPSVVALKGATATLKFTKYFQNRADANYFFNNSARACILTITNNQIVSSTDTGNKKYQIQFKMPQLIFKTYSMPTATDAVYAYTIEAEVMYDSTAGYAIRAIVQNAKAGTEYTA